MSKTQTLRDTMAAIGAPASLEFIIGMAEKASGQLFNAKKTRDLLTFMASKGEVIGEGKGEERTWHLSGKPPKKKAAKKTRPKKAQTSAPRTYRDVARKVKHLAVSIPSLKERHVATTFAALESVIEIDSADPMLAAAIQSHREAIELLGDRT